MLKYIFFLGLFTLFFVQPFLIYTNFFISILLLIILVIKNYSNRKFIKESFDSYGQLMLIWFVWGALSLLWVQSVGGWINHVMILFEMFIYTITIKNLSKHKKFKTQLEHLLLAIIIVNVLIGLFELYSGIYLFTLNKENVQSYRFMRYPVSFFYNPNDYAVFLTFSVVFIITYVENKFNKLISIIFKFLKLLLLSCIFLLLVYTQARLNLLASLISIVLFYLISMENGKTKYLFALLSLVVIGIIGFNFENIIQLMGGFVKSDESSLVRVNLIKNGMLFLKESNYIGIGAGNAKYYLSYFGKYNTMEITDMHNWWIEILTNYGVVFSVYYLIVYLKLLIKGVQLRREKNMLFSLLWMIAFIPASVASSSAFQYFWLWVINAWVYSMISDKPKVELS